MPVVGENPQLMNMAALCMEMYLERNLLTLLIEKKVRVDVCILIIQTPKNIHVTRRTTCVQTCCKVATIHCKFLSQALQPSKEMPQKGFIKRRTSKKSAIASQRFKTELYFVGLQSKVWMLNAQQLVFAVVPSVF